MSGPGRAGAGRRQGASALVPDHPFDDGGHGDELKVLAGFKDDQKISRKNACRRRPDALVSPERLFQRPLELFAAVEP
jgi:hypothetical protein